MKSILPLFFFFGFTLLNAQSDEIQMDGFFEDWQDFSYIEKESNPSNSIDLIELSLSNDDNFLYLRIKLDREVLFQQSNIQVWIDADNNAGTGQNIRSMGSEFYYHFGQRRGSFLGQEIGHFDIGLVSLPTHSGDEFEIRIRRNATPTNSRELFTSNTFQLLVGGSNINTDALPVSGTFSYTFDEGPFPEFTPISIQKSDPSHIRLMNQNILFDRPLNPAFQNQFKRIVQAVNADIFCFNEFFDASASTVKNLMDSTIPLNNTNGWYASKVDDDNITVSRYPILASIKLTNSDRISANLLDLPDDYGTDMLVIVCHFSCCDNETARQFQVDAVAAFIQEARNEGGRLDIDDNTPILITGDFNMVGLKQQRETLLTGDIQNTQRFGTGSPPDWDGSPISDLVPYHTDIPIATTWINPFSSFAPGRLDYILYSDSRLEAQKGFLLQTNEMSSDSLTAYGLSATDTDFSDHLPIVGDFSIKDLSTSSEEKLENMASKIYPNPTNGSVRIELKNSSYSNGTISIFHLDGRLLNRVQINGFQHDLDLTQLPSGVYIISIRQDNSVERRRIIKN